MEVFVEWSYLSLILETLWAECFFRYFLNEPKQIIKKNWPKVNVFDKRRDASKMYFPQTFFGSNWTESLLCRNLP